MPIISDAIKNSKLIVRSKNKTWIIDSNGHSKPMKEIISDETAYELALMKVPLVDFTNAPEGQSAESSMQDPLPGFLPSPPPYSRFSKVPFDVYARLCFDRGAKIFNIDLISVNSCMIRADHKDEIENFKRIHRLKGFIENPEINQIDIHANHVAQPNEVIAKHSPSAWCDRVKAIHDCYPSIENKYLKMWVSAAYGVVASELLINKHNASRSIMSETEFFERLSMIEEMINQIDKTEAEESAVKLMLSKLYTTNLQIDSSRLLH